MKAKRPHFEYPGGKYVGRIYDPILAELFDIDGRVFAIVGGKDRNGWMAYPYINGKVQLGVSKAVWLSTNGTMRPVS